MHAADLNGRLDTRVPGWGWPVAATGGLNLCFLLLQLLSASLPTDRLQARVVDAFQANSLSQQDGLRFNSGIGWHQYNDCLILQMISNDDRPLRKSLGPVAYYRDDFHGLCQTVYELVNGQISAGQLESFRYTRYWHGHNALTALMLSAWEFGTVRSVLKAVTYLSLFVLAIVAWRSHAHLRVFGLVMAAFGALFWGLPYFSQSPSHGPGDTAVVLGFALLLAIIRRGISIGGYRVYCAAFGAVLTYMEFLTGLLPTAAAFLLPLGYFAAAGAGIEHGDVRRRWKFALHGMVGFVLGVLLTVAIKQALALVLFGPQAISAFTGNLEYYAQTPAHVTQSRLLAVPWIVLETTRRWGRILAYGSSAGALLLFAGSSAAWLAALLLALRTRSATSLSAFFVCVAGSLAIAVWIFALPTHSYNHPFMVRIMIAPLALGWIALLIQFRRLEEP